MMRIPLVLATLWMGGAPILALDPPEAHAASSAREQPSSGARGTGDITEIDLEELMKVEVTSPSRKEQKQIDAASAIYVIRRDELKRTGATSIPEALRMVPGLQVARLDANKWAVSARGFNGRFANKLLVLVDGRSVYTPLFSGVYWDVQDTLLEDVDRIEVIRGPGATLWGANAVNGVINIITRSSKETQGVLATAGGGTEDRAFGGLRYGFRLGGDDFARVYAKYFKRDEGRDGHDDWSVVRGGFRSDWKLGKENALTFQGDYYDAEAGSLLTTPTLTSPFAEVFSEQTQVSGGNLVLRWERELEPGSPMALQLYYDRTVRRTRGLLRETRHTGELDFQHRFSPFSGHDVVWGLGYRVTADSIRNSFGLSFDPPERTDDLFSAFIQDEISFVEDRLQVIVGSKMEHNDYTAFEFQPSARLAWKPDARQVIWTSLSRAVRTPSRAEDDLRINRETRQGPLPILIALFGDRDFRSEDLMALEAGYRNQPADAFSFDLAAFYNIYSRLRTLEQERTFLEASPGPPHLVVPFRADNNMEARTWGVELAANVQAADWWLVQASYALLLMDVDPSDRSNDRVSAEAERESPRNQVWVRSAMDLPGNLRADLIARHVGALSALDVDAYVEIDARLAWRDPKAKLEVALVGQNLLDAHHLEFKPSFIQTQPTEVERSVYLSLTWRF